MTEPYVLNPSAIGDPNQTPIVQLPDDDTPCGHCGHAWDLHNHHLGDCLDGWHCDDAGWYPGKDGCLCFGWEEPV